MEGGIPGFYALSAMILFLFQGSLSSSICPVVYNYSTTPTTTINDTASSSYREDLIKKLFDLCCSNDQCSSAYHQHYRKNITVFRHLLWTYEMEEMDRPLQNLLCNGGEDRNLDEASNELKVMTMIVNRKRNQPQCDVNHKLIFDTAGLASHCECRPDRVCDDSLFDLLPFYLLLIGFFILSLMVGAMAIYKSVMELLALDHVMELQALDRSTNKPPQSAYMDGLNALNRIIA